MTLSRANLFETLSKLWCLNKKQRKYAILIGPSYQSSLKLNSTYNDINNINNLLINLMDYKKENIYILTDNKIIPTKTNIIKKLKEIIKLIKPNDYLFFYFTGHGIKNGLVTEDEQLILNYELKNVINLLPKKIHFFSLIDCCHSDNKFKFNYYYLKKWVTVKKYNKTNEKYFLLSACTKDETTLEMKINNEYHSFITKLFVKFITLNPNIAWIDLFNYLNLNILINNYKQHPMFSSTFIFDLKTKVYF